MNLALIGYGKMGKAIEEIALQKGHNIVLKIDITNADEFNQANLSKADVAIEFTGPESAVDNVKKCIEAGVPVVSGSTGWLDKWKEVVQFCNENNGGLLYASNFSIGVNIFFEVNRHLGRLMASRNEYNVSVEEIHHKQKKDAPSGTAITLAEGILENLPAKNKWALGETSQKDELSIISKRIDPAPGTHIITYDSPVDSIEIKHTAHSRTGFASGAVLAAEFMIGKIGVYGMKDVLKIN